MLAKLNQNAPLFTSFYWHPGQSLLDTRFDNTSPSPLVALPIECGWKRTSRHETQPNMSMFVHFKR